MAEDITQLLLKWSSGDPDALNDLAPRVYSEPRKLAHGYLHNERPGHTLQSTALVNEAFLKLVDQDRVQWRNRAHFFGIAAQAMRRILLDYARGRRRDKRGGGVSPIPYDDALGIGVEREVELIALDDALTSLAQLDPQQSRIVELRYFAGLSIDETAEVLGISKATANRDWATARAWLARELRRGPSS